MATIDMTSRQLDQIGNYLVMRNFLMFTRRGWHIRLDQKAITQGGSLSVEYVDSKGAPTGVWGYRISSFHVKRDFHDNFISTSEGPYLGKKITVDDSRYVYFTYAGGGVWQPIWGYGKFVQKHKGETIWQPDNAEMDAETWSFACDKARWFLDQLNRASGGDHGLAMGPVQGAAANVFNQL